MFRSHLISITPPRHIPSPATSNFMSFKQQPWRPTCAARILICVGLSTHWSKLVPLMKTHSLFHSVLKNIRLARGGGSGSTAWSCAGKHNCGKFMSTEDTGLLLLLFVFPSGSFNALAISSWALRGEDVIRMFLWWLSHPQILTSCTLISCEFRC